MDRICPVINRAMYPPNNERNEGYGFVDCVKSGCQLWITVFTTERKRLDCCSYEMEAMKNSEGLYRV